MRACNVFVHRAARCRQIGTPQPVRLSAAPARTRLRGEDQCQVATFAMQQDATLLPDAVRVEMDTWVVEETELKLSRPGAGFGGGGSKSRPWRFFRESRKTRRTPPGMRKILHRTRERREERGEKRGGEQELSHQQSINGANEPAQVCACLRMFITRGCCERFLICARLQSCFQIDQIESESARGGPTDQLPSTKSVDRRVNKKCR